MTAPRPKLKLNGTEALNLRSLRNGTWNWMDWVTEQKDWRRADRRSRRTYKLTSCLGKWANGSRQLTDWRPAFALRTSSLPRWGFLFSVELELRKRIFNWQVALNCTQGRVQGAKLQIIVYFSVSISLYAVIPGKSCYFRFSLIWLICVVDMQLLHIIEMIMDCTIYSDIFPIEIIICSVLYIDTSLAQQTLGMKDFRK